MDYYERLKTLGISSLQRRREKIIIINIWKIKNGILPNAINLNFKDHFRSKALRAVLPKLPRTHCSLLSKYENSFLIIGCKLWNSLPAYLTHIQNYQVFKLHLNRYLSEIPDRPPLPGYRSINNNSLIMYKTVQK